MLVHLEVSAGDDDVARVTAAAAALGMHAQVIRRDGRVAVAVTGGVAPPPRAAFEGLARVTRVEDASAPYLLASRGFRAEDTLVDVSGLEVGGNRVVLMAGPCAVEGADQ